MNERRGEESKTVESIVMSVVVDIVVSSEGIDSADPLSCLSHNLFRPSPRKKLKKNQTLSKQAERQADREAGRDKSQRRG